MQRRIQLAATHFELDMPVHCSLCVCMCMCAQHELLDVTYMYSLRLLHSLNVKYNVGTVCVCLLLSGCVCNVVGCDLLS